MSLESQKALSAAWQKLTAKLFDKKEELRLLEAQRGRELAEASQALSRLAKEIDSLEKRLDVCERAMECVHKW